MVIANLANLQTLNTYVFSVTSKRITSIIGPHNK
jgi:hypothetical protein